MAGFAVSWKFRLRVSAETFIRSGRISVTAHGLAVTVKANMQQIDWGLKFPYRSIARKTPKSTVATTEVQETELCPYGCARLRMTEMPLLGKKKQ